MAILRPVAGGDQEPRLVQSRLPTSINFDGQRDLRRTKSSQHLQQGHDVSAVRAQPARLLHSKAIHRGVEACSRDAAEEHGARDLALGFRQAAQLRLHDARSQLWMVATRIVRHKVQRLQRLILPGERCFVFRLVDRLNRSQINGANIVACRAEAPPGCEGLLDRLDSNGPREVVRASQGNDERRNLLQRQSAEMAMNGAVAAEDKRRIRLVCGIEFVAGEQVYARQLKSPDMMFFGDRSEKGDSAHGATLAQEAGNSKSRRMRGAIRFSPFALRSVSFSSLAELSGVEDLRSALHFSPRLLAFHKAVIPSEAKRSRGICGSQRRAKTG